MQLAPLNRAGGNAAPTFSIEYMGAAVSGTLLAVLRIYKRWISPMLPSACRFHPTCSEYMIEAIERHGVARGGSMGLRRLLRCHPFHEGGFDPVR
jgi:putative membrane protein insertion efficiency factor